MIVAYVAGPYSDPNPNVILDHVTTACDVARDLVKLGIVPLVPHAIGWWVDQAVWQTVGTPEWWYRATEQLMLRCDILVLGPGWCDSRGARQEREVWLEAVKRSAKSRSSIFEWPEDAKRLQAIMRMGF